MGNRIKTICVVSPFPPPYGGMAIQAEKIVSLLRNDGFRVLPVRTNPDLQGHFTSKIKGLRTLTRTIAFLGNLRMALDQADVVYFLTGFFNFFFWVTYPALILIKLNKKRVILSARGGEAARFFKKYGFFIRPVLKSVTISVPSGFLEGAFREALNINPTVVPNIADLQQFQFRERMPVRPRLIVTRSLEKIYNVACVIRAFKEVHDQFPDSVLGIIGDGAERSQLEELAAELGLRHCITFYGATHHAQMQKYYDDYDIFVNASNVDNLPGVILEAFASGLPVVSTKAGGIPHVVRDGFTGLLVEKEDFEGLAHQVVMLLKNPQTALTLARNARDECDKYSWDNIRQILYPLLEGEASPWKE